MLAECLPHYAHGAIDITGNIQLFRSQIFFPQFNPKATERLNVRGTILTVAFPVAYILLNNTLSIRQNQNTLRRRFFF